MFRRDYGLGRKKKSEDYDFSDIFEGSNYQPSEEYMSNIFTLKWKDLLGAAVSGALVEALGYIAKLTPAEALHMDWHQITGIAIIAMATSLLKSFMTNSEGKFLGAVKVK